MTLTACNSGNEIRVQNDAVKALLPNQEGYVWLYEGFAEYFHVMEVESIFKEGNGYRYLIQGSVADISSGESDLDFSIAIEYIIQDGTLTQIKQEEVMMDSIFDEIELIRVPLQQGTVWNQTQIDQDGTERTLICTIEEVRTSAGRTYYTVMYQDEDSEYYEKREFRSGIGVTRVETLWVTDDGNFPLEYILYRSLGPDENT